MVILVIIGALIGAGFASGQEIYLFFYRYNYGIFGLIICSILISFIIYKVLKIIIESNIETYQDFLNKIFLKNEKNKYLNISYITNIVINIFLLASFFIMISGFGAYFNQELEINRFIGSSILAIICFAIFTRDMKGVAKVNSIVVPILIFCVIFIGIKNISLINFNDIGVNNISIKQNIFNNWFLQSIIYSSYNIILLIPVIVNLKKYIKNKKDITFISMLTGAILFILAINIYLLLVNIDVSFNEIEMPAIYAISNISIYLKNIYGIVILLSIFTTAISLGMSFLDNIIKDKKNIPQYASILCITSILISNFGFSNLVNWLYPIFGYLGLIQIYYILKN